MIWTDRNITNWAVSILSWWACAQGAAVAHADEVHTHKKTYHDASVRHFDGEYVIFSNAAGDAIARKLNEIDAIYVDSVQRFEEFNRAERAFQQQRYRDAAKKYQNSLGRARGFWKDLIRIRHLQACDAAGDFDLAVKAYITIVQTMPDKAEAFMPTNLTDATAKSQRRALQLLQEALPKINDQAAYWELEALRLTILEGTESEQAEQIAREIIARLQRARGHKSRYRLQIIAIRVEVKHKQYEVAVGHINEALKDAGDRYLPELLFLKGKCLFGLAENRDDFIRAALAFMRVVIHFPKSRLGAQSMYMAGVVHEKINRTVKAIELYEGCKELPGATDEIVRLADAAVRRAQNRQ